MKLTMNNLKKNLTSGAIVVCLAFGATAATAQTPVALADDEHINTSLLSAKIGLIIQSRCSSISPRLFLAMKKARALKKYARDRGYTEAEVKAYVTGEAEKKRVRKAAHAYLNANGAKKHDEQSYCTIGRAEIAKKSLTGQLLSSS